MGKIDATVMILCNNPLLFSSPSLQPIIAAIIRQTFRESTHATGNIAAFVWDYFATVGIDVSCFMNAFQLSNGISIYDIFFPPIYLKPFELDLSKDFLKAQVYCNFKYMAMMSIMRVAKDKGRNAPDAHHASIKQPAIIELSIRHLPAIIELFVADKMIESYLYHSVITTISRVAKSCPPKVTCALLGPHWTKKWLIDSLGLLDYSVIGTISCDPEEYGPLVLSTLMSRPGKEYFFDDIISIPKNHNFIVGFLEHGNLNDEHFTKASTDYFYAFIREALFRAPKDFKIAMSDHLVVMPKDCNEQVIMRLQFMFNPYFDFKKGDLETYALDKCSTHRNIVHSMVKAIFDTPTEGIFSILVQILYEHYKSCKTQLSSPKKDITKEPLESLKCDAENDYLKRHLLQLSLTNPQFCANGLNGPRPTKASCAQKSANKPDKTGVHTSTSSSKRVHELNTSIQPAKLSAPKPFASKASILKRAEPTELAKQNVGNEDVGDVIPLSHTVKAKTIKSEVKKENNNQRKFGKEEDVDAEVDYFYSTPTPKKQVQEVTHLDDNIALYFSPSGDGSLKPNSSLKPGIHKLLLKHANMNGFPFLLDESFYNFLVDEEYKVDMKSSGSQLELWKEAKEKVPLKDGRTRLKLWVPKDFGVMSIAKGSILRVELGKIFNDNVDLCNRLCSLLQYSMQGTKTLNRIVVKPASNSSQKVKIQNGTLFLDSSVTAKNLFITISNFLTFQPLTTKEESPAPTTDETTTPYQEEEPKSLNSEKAIEASLTVDLQGAVITAATTISPFI